MKSRQSTITSTLVFVVGLAAAIGLYGAAEPIDAANAETPQTIALEVDGMQNVGCALQVRHTLEGLEGVAGATVDLGAGSARVEQALYEEMAYDGDGNPVTVTLADYTIPSAADLPSFELLTRQTPTPNNALGAKGVGEAGTIGSTPAIQNAVIDAVSHLGVRHIDMPLTAERVWRAIQEATA